MTATRIWLRHSARLRWRSSAVARRWGAMTKARLSSRLTFASGRSTASASSFSTVLRDRTRGDRLSDAGALASSNGPGRPSCIFSANRSSTRPFSGGRDRREIPAPRDKLGAHARAGAPTLSFERPVRGAARFRLAQRAAARPWDGAVGRRRRPAGLPRWFIADSPSNEGSVVDQDVAPSRSSSSRSASIGETPATKEPACVRMLRRIRNTADRTRTFRTTPRLALGGAGRHHA